MLSCACPGWAGAPSPPGDLRSWARGAPIVRTSLSMTGLGGMGRRGGGGGKRVGRVDWYADCCDEKPSAEQQSQSGTDVACVISFLYRRCNPDTPSCNAGLA